VIGLSRMLAPFAYGSTGTPQLAGGFDIGSAGESLLLDLLERLGGSEPPPVEHLWADQEGRRTGSRVTRQ
jgi:hypothetical protein